MPNFLVPGINGHTFFVVHYKDHYYQNILSSLTPPRKKSHDRVTRKMFYIGKSDDNCCCNIRSPPNTVRKQHTEGLHEEQHFINTPRSGKYSTHVHQQNPQQKTGKIISHSSRRQDEHNQLVTAYSSNREQRTLRRSRTPITTERKAKKNDLSPRTSKKSVSSRSEISSARRSWTDNTEKTVKRDKHGDSHCQRPSTDDISSRRPDNSKSYFTYRHKKGFASPSYKEKTEQDTDTDTMKESPPKGRKQSSSPTEVRHR